MCGIVAALPFYSGPDDSTSGDLGRIHSAEFTLSEAGERKAADRLDQVADELVLLRRELEAPSAVALLAGDRVRLREVEDSLSAADRWTASLDAELQHLTQWPVEAIERTQEALRTVTDRLWALRTDVLEQIRAVPRIVGEHPGTRAAVSALSILRVLAAIDRLEVRGRDSAGVSIIVSLDPTDAATVDVTGRDDVLMRSGTAVRVRNGVVFSYKHAAIVGRLGDNVASLRRTLESDRDLRHALTLPSAEVAVLAHTRWASVGRISESNAHPVDSRDAAGSSTGPYTLAVLNGDIDNYLELPVTPLYSAIAEAGVTTDAKVVPLTLARHLQAGADGGTALRSAAREFRGSMAIASQSEVDPDQMMLLVKGSGQGLYVGVSDHGYFVASEVYGLVGVTDRYVRMDAGAHGEVLVLDRGEGDARGVWRLSDHGSGERVEDAELRVAEVTTRDLALGESEHYLAKEIGEASSAFAKTLRGRVRPDGDLLRAWLSDSSFPDALATLAGSGGVREVVVIGQGTAAVAARGVAHLMRTALPAEVDVRATPATEFSMYGLSATGPGTLVVAISQSGSTTDTNRGVALARERGATVLAIVNRRDSDLAALSDGVVYTSDGRDVEMSVASTKAFYAQIAAGCLIGLRLGRETGGVSAEAEDRLLRALVRVPEQLERLYATSGAIAEIAGEVATEHVNWAVVGSGPGSVAAAEIRIKLSELCYKTVSVDAIEDKKHIDLSAEALVLVCAAGAQPHHLPDIVKEVEIYSAHRNRPVVICDEGSEDQWPTGALITVPRTRPELAWILGTAAGHLFAYHAARAIDASGAPLREALGALEAAVDQGRDVDVTTSRQIAGNVTKVVERAARGELAGVLTSDTALGLAMLVSRQLSGLVAGEGRADVRRRDDVDAARTALTAALDQLTRSIDTVKHQAKTVTVGTSRSDAGLFDNKVVSALEAAGSDVHALPVTTLRALAAFGTLTAGVNGVTRYAVDGALTRVVGKTGIALELRSRAETPVPLVGSKRLVVETGEPRFVRGRSDGRTIIVVPEHFFEDDSTPGVAVVHVDLVETAEPASMLAALQHMRARWLELRALVTETAPDLGEREIATLTPGQLLLDPVEDVAAVLSRGRSA